MADDGVYTTGQVTTALGSTGVLQKILDVCTGGIRPGKDWVIETTQNSKDSGLADAFPGASPMPKEVILKNTGTSGSEEIFIGFREWRHTVNDYWGLDLNGYVYDPLGNWQANKGQHNLTVYDGTYEHWLEMPILQMANSTMNYYLRSDKDHIAITLEVSNDFFTCYVGFGERLGSPGEYPCPMFVGGSSVGNRKYDYADSVGPVRPVAGTFFFIGPDNSYHTKDGAAASHPYIYPMQGESNTFTVGLAPGNKLFTTPAFATVNYQDLFTLKDMYGVRGPSLQSGQTYQQDGYNLILFQQGLNTATYNFLARHRVTTTTTTTSTTSTTTTS